MRNEDKPITTLLADLARETGDLVQQEVRLAKAEINEKITTMNRGLTSLITGGVIILAGLLVLLQAVVFGVDELISPWTEQAWVAPLIVGVIVSLIGIWLLQKGRHNLQPGSLAPRRSAESLRHDKNLLREQFK